MTSFIFCLIFIQVSVFLIAGILLLASFFFGLRSRESARAVAPRRIRRRQSNIVREAALTQSELEYLLAEEPAAS